MFFSGLDLTRVIATNPPNHALEPTTLAVMPCAPSSTSHASQGRGSSLTLGRNFDVSY